MCVRPYVCVCVRLCIQGISSSLAVSLSLSLSLSACVCMRVCVLVIITMSDVHQAHTDDNEASSLCRFIKARLHHNRPEHILHNAVS